VFRNGISAALVDGRAISKSAGICGTLVVMSTVIAGDVHPGLEQHRVELTGYCYRILGSPFDAEDAVQETLVRAWRNLDRFDEARGSLRTWLYAIATNICFDMLRSAQRRARAVDLGPPSQPGSPLGEPLPDGMWVQPVPDSMVLPAHGDPAEMVVARETIRLAFIAALQHLPPRQRAVLILRDVLCWKADEVAGLLDTTVASVNSAVQRARSTIQASNADSGEPFQPMDEAQQRLLARYVTAFEQHNVEELVSLLHEDATMSMPPFAWWLRGRDQLSRALSAAEAPCGEARLLATVANGLPAFGQYWSGVPFALLVVEVADGRIMATTTHLDPARLFPLFGLPTVLR
jgi:RNA polymerase sigma-70 factor, ECF subfamily